jgi:dihydrofolate reductase
MPPRKSIVVAIAEKTRGIGNGPDLLFRFKEDLQRFKKLTSHHPVIMGRKTFESIGRPLPNRNNIVITRNAYWEHPTEVAAYQSLAKALAYAQTLQTDEIFIIGGGEIYAEALTHVDRLYITIVHADKPATVFFPEYSHLFTKEISREEYTDTETGITMSFVVLDK